MDGWVPKGGSLPPGGDGAFERFLTAAIAAIITIMFSWRLLDDMHDDDHALRPGKGEEEDEEERRRRRATAYAAIALASSSSSSRPPPPQLAITELDIDEGGRTVGKDQRRATATPRGHDSGFASWGRGPGPVGHSSAGSSSVDWDCSSVDMMKCFTSAPPVYLPTAADSSSHTTPPPPSLCVPLTPDTATAAADTQLTPADGRTGRQSPMDTLPGSEDDDDDNDDDDSREELWDSEREMMMMMKDGTTLMDWPPDGNDDLYNVSGDSSDDAQQQPRELDSDEELYCCSLLEPIIEEDSDDFLSSSADSDPGPHHPHPHSHPHLHPPALPRHPVPPMLGRKFSDEHPVRSAAPVSEVGQLGSKPSPQAVVEDVFSPTSPLIPDRGDHSGRHSPDAADDSESDESVQTVIRRESVPSSLESSPLHGPAFSFSAPESPVCEKRLSSPKRYGGGSGGRPSDTTGRSSSRVVYPECADEVLSWGVLETNHPEHYRERGWGLVKTGREAAGGNCLEQDDVDISSDDNDNDSTIDNIPCPSVEEEGEEGEGEASTPVVVAPLCAAELSTKQPQAPAISTHSALSGQPPYARSTQTETSSPREERTDNPRSKIFTENHNYVETDLDDVISQATASGSEKDWNMARRGKDADSFPPRSSAIDSFLTEFEDEPFARRRGRRGERSPPREEVVVVADKLTEKKEADRTHRPPHTRSSASGQAPKPKRTDISDLLVTDLDEALSAGGGRPDGAGREGPREKSSPLQSGGESNSAMDIDTGAVRQLKRKAQPVVVELDEEPFVRRRGGGSDRWSAPEEPDWRRSAPTRTEDRKPVPMKSDDRKSVPMKTDDRKSVPLNSDDRKSLPLKTDARYSTPIETDFTVPEKHDMRQTTPMDTRGGGSQLETDIDGDDSPPLTGESRDRDSGVTRGQDPWMVDLEDEPFARRPRPHVKPPTQEHDLSRSRTSDSESYRSLNDSKNESDRHSDRKPGSSGRSATDPESSFNRSVPDPDPDPFKQGRRDSETEDRQSFHSARSDTDLDRSGGRTSDRSIDSFLTELDEEPFARRVGRGRRRASPERAGDRHRPPLPAQPPPSSPPPTFPSLVQDTCLVLEESPSVSRPPELAARERTPSPQATVKVPDSPTVSMPTAVLMTRADTRITSTPQKPESNREPEECVAVPASPTISMPGLVEEGPQVRMSYSTTSRIGTSAVVREDPREEVVQQALPQGPYTDATESSAVERTPRGYTFTRCESESVRSERRIYLVDTPMAPDFETFINSVPFTSEMYSQGEEDSSSDFDGYSSFVQNLHRPSCSGAELSAALPLKTPDVEEGCILSGNLVTPPNTDIFRFPPTPQGQLPAVSSVAQNMVRSDSAEVGSDSEREKSSRAEGSSGDVLDTSFDIDSTGVREKMETDFAFLQSGNTVHMPPRRDDKSRPPDEDRAEDMSSERSDEGADDRRRRKRDHSVSRDSDRKRRKSDDHNDRSDGMSSSDHSSERIDHLERTGKPRGYKVTLDRPGHRPDDMATDYVQDRSDEEKDRASKASEDDREDRAGRKEAPHSHTMTSERAGHTITRTEPSDSSVPVQAPSSARLEEAPPILFFQPAALLHTEKKPSPAESQPWSFRDTPQEARQRDVSPIRQEAVGSAPCSRPEEKGDTIYIPMMDSSPKGKERRSVDLDRSTGSDINTSGQEPKLILDRSDIRGLDRKENSVKESPTTIESPRTEESLQSEVSPRMAVSPRRDASPETEVSAGREASAETEASAQRILMTESSAYPLTTEKPPLPKPRSLSRPTPMPRSKSLGDNVGSPSFTSPTGEDEDVFHREGSDSDSADEEELLFKAKQSTPVATEEKRPRSLKEIRRMQKSTRPMIAPFTLPDHIVLPSRLKIVASRRQFLSSENLDASPNTSLQEQFAAHKASQQQAKERLYKSPNKRFTSPSFSSQDQLEKLHYMLNYSRQSESSFERSRVDHLHEGCILTPEGRRSILDKTLSIDNLQVDLPQHLRKFGSVTSLVETDIDTGETLETNFFPETNLDIFDHLFQSHQPLQRSASMSDMVLNERRDDDLDLHHESRSLHLSLPPSQSHKSTGKGRFAHRKHHKSKSLCTLETNLDEVGEDGEDPSLRRVPSVHELRVTKSLQKLNVPDWFKQSSLSKSSSCLLKYGSNSTMNSFSFSPSLISSPCASTAPPAPNVVIKTRVVPPSNPRVLRSSHFTTPATMPSSERKPLTTPVKLPSERLREKEKNKNLMPIPIVPFAQIRAMFEKKAKAEEEKKEATAGEERRGEVGREPKGKLDKMPPLSKPALPSISISGEDGEMRPEESKPTSVKRNVVEKPPASPARTSPPPVVPQTITVTASPPTSAQPPTAPTRPVHKATANGVSDDVEGNAVSSTVAPRMETFPPSVSTAGRSHPVVQKPPISPTSAEPKPWRDARDSARKTSPRDSGKEPKSPTKDSKTQFSPSRSLRQFFGRSKDKGSEKKSEGAGSLDSSFSSGDGVYEKEPRRIGGSDSGRRPTSTSPTSTSFERRSDLDSSFSSAEGQPPPPSGPDTSSRSLEGAPSMTSRTSAFPASSGGPRSSYVSSERAQPPFSRIAAQDDWAESPRTASTSRVSDGGEGVGAPSSQKRLLGAGTSFGHTSLSSENGEHVPELPSPSSTSDSSATAAGEKKSVKETTV